MGWTLLTPSLPRAAGREAAPASSVFKGPGARDADPSLPPARAWERRLVPRRGRERDAGRMLSGGLGGWVERTGGDGNSKEDNKNN